MMDFNAETLLVLWISMLKQSCHHDDFMDFNAKTLLVLWISMLKQKFNNSAHSYYGLLIKDAVPVHDTMRNNLNPSPDDRETQVITY